MKQKSYLANNPVQVLGRVTDKQYQDIVHAGTPRDGRRGGCYLWNTVNYISVPAINGDIESVTALNELGQIINLSSTFVTDHYEIRGNTGEYAWNIKCWGSGVTPTDSQKSSYTLNGSGGEANLYTWLHADENSGNIAYKAFKNGVNGQIMDAVTTTPEVNPLSIHQYQDIYSWHNVVGCSIDNSGTYPVYIPRDESIQPPPFKDVLGNDLQYIGHCQNNADFAGSACLDNSNATQSYAATNAYQSSDYMEYEFWMYPSANKTVGQSYVIGTRQSGRSVCCVYYDAGGTALTVQNYLGQTTTSGGSTFPREEWHLAKVRFFNDTVEFYRNNILISTQSLTNGNGLFYGPITIGIFLQNPPSQQFVGKLMDVKIKNLDQQGNFVSWFGHYPLCEPIIDPTNHTYHDKIGGNHASLINGSSANQGSQDEFHDLMKNGFVISDGVNYYKDQALTQLIPLGHYIPAHATIQGKCVAYTIGGVLADLTTIQNGKSFLDCGTKLRQRRIPELIQADASPGPGIWFDVNGNPLDISFADIEGVVDNQVFSDISESIAGGKITNIRTHKTPLQRAQLDTEKRITNN